MAQRKTYRAFIAAIVIVETAMASAQSDRSRAMGAVVDTSGGALPGVTVTMTGRAIAPVTVITDDAGRYLTPWLAPGTYKVSFALSGFESRDVTGVVLGAAQTIVLDQQLPLAGLSETVEVTAPAPVPPPPPLPPPPPPRPRPIVKRDPELLASVCGPAEPTEVGATIARIVSGRDDARQLMGPQDIARIDAGETHGLAVGQALVIRRRFQTGDRNAPKKLRTFGEQTVGLAEIIETNASSASALIVYACGEVLAGDTLETYVAQPARFSVPDGLPRFDEPAHVAFAEYDRAAAATGQMLVIDRGWMQGVQRGHRLTIFREGAGRSPVIIGEGIVIAVRSGSATIRIDHSTDAVYVSDLIALHR